MKWIVTLVVVVVGGLLYQPTDSSRTLDKTGMCKVWGGQEMEDPGTQQLNRRCVHVDAVYGTNPCVANESCPTDVSECTGIQEYTSTDTFWKCMPWLFTSHCTVSQQTATCLFSLPCGVFDGVCQGNPDPFAVATAVVAAPTDCDSN